MENNELKTRGSKKGLPHMRHHKEVFRYEGTVSVAEDGDVALVNVRKTNKHEFVAAKSPNTELAKYNNEKVTVIFRKRTD